MEAKDFAELENINSIIRGKKELIIVPKSFFNLGLSGRALIIYDYLSRCQYVSLKANATPNFNPKIMAANLKFTLKETVDSINELIKFGIVLIKERVDEYSFNFKIDYTYLFSE